MAPGVRLRRPAGHEPRRLHLVHQDGHRGPRAVREVRELVHRGRTVHEEIREHIAVRRRQRFEPHHRQLPNEPLGGRLVYSRYQLAYFVHDGAHIISLDI